MISNHNELRTAVTILSSNINNMCNCNDVNKVVDTFIEAKDLLIEIYKYNVERLQK